MESRLDRLLADIAPRRTLEEVARRTDEALNAFSANGAQITDWDEFRQCLIRYMRQVESRILGIRAEQFPRVGADFHWGRCCHVLTRIFGPNGDKAAFEMARTGTEGGLYAVLKAMARQLADRYARNEVAARVSDYWDSLSMDEKFAAADEYLCKYGHLLPSELTEESGIRVRANLPKALNEHPRLTQRLGQIGRR